MSRIDNIANFAKKKEEEALTKELALQRQIELAKEQIKLLKPRIDELISVANACMEHGIEINARMNRMYGQDKWEEGTFVTNSISHKIGFVTRRKMEITHMGINAGGACGSWDFRTDGENTFSADEDNPKITKEPLLHHCKEFLADFDKFEAEFYKYIDNLTK